MTTLLNDLKYALRMLRKRPGFTAIALLTLAIGVGANTIVFSLVNTLLFRHSKVKDADQLLLCSLDRDKTSWFRYSEYLTLRDNHLAFSGIIAQDIGWGYNTTVMRGDAAWKMEALYVSSNYFSVLGVQPILGRAFLPEEERQDSIPVAVLGYRS